MAIKMDQLKTKTPLTSGDGETHTRNVGLDLLRIWMCYEVVVAHLKDWGGVDPSTLSAPLFLIYRCKSMAAGVFMLLSFILTDVAKLSQSAERLRRKAYHLLVPTVFWAITYFVIYKILDLINGTHLIRGYMDLPWQLLTGHSYNQTLWFQFALIVLTALFCVVFRTMNKKGALSVSALLFCVSIYMQYSGINGRMFDGIQWPQKVFGSHFSSMYVAYPVGRLVEMLPVAGLGILLNQAGALQKASEYRLAVVVGALFLLHTILRWKVFETPPGYYYQGLYVSAVVILLVLLFNCLPFEWLPEVLRRGIGSLAKRTMAVYFMHRLVDALLCNTVIGQLIPVVPRTLLYCGVVYVICCFVAYALGKVPIKWVRASMS